MGQEPAVVIIARHGARLDAADQNWHLSTPTPYDPPLTYGGWNQCRALGVRIASLLHAREESFDDTTREPPPPEGVRSRDFAGQNGQSTGHEDGSRKRKRKRKHKVVVHSSPFLRCLQTSVAISAGMAQYTPGMNGAGMGTKSRTPSSMHSASPRLRAMDNLGATSPSLTPISEPKHDFAHVMARKALGEQRKRHRRSKMRVDAFLGEWLNPQYFDQITPPPPSAMMVATAKGELVSNESIDVYTPTVSSRGSSLWGGGANSTRSLSRDSRDSSTDEWQHVQDALPPPAIRRDRASSVNSASSNESNSTTGSKSPFRAGHVLHPNTSALPKIETSVYNPPTPHYAVSTSDQIPKGYTAHARNATVNVDVSWDSSRQPQNWGDGGKLGEEWSSMHKRFRRGLNNLVDWYGAHGIDDRAEDALGFEQAERHAEHEDDTDEQEDLVVVLVTHGAGSNALIGALTGQPVLLDVGMASLTMAVRKDDAPASRTPNRSTINGHARTSSQDLPLSALYEMKLVASTEHLRPGSDPSRPSPSSLSPIIRDSNYAIPRSLSAAGLPTLSSTKLESNQSASLGSIRRPSKPDPSALPLSLTTAGRGLQRRSTEPRNGVDHDSPVAAPSLPASATSASSTGLWTPPSAAPKTAPVVEGERKDFFEAPESKSPKDLEAQDDAPLNGSRTVTGNGEKDSRPSTAHNKIPAPLDGAVDSPLQPLTTRASPPSPKSTVPPRDTTSPPSPESKSNGTPLAPIPSTDSERDDLPDLPSPEAKVPPELRRGLSQKGLWGSRPSGSEVSRNVRGKRRWTLSQK